MQSEAVPTSSALFGADGTQLPDPLPVLPDPLTGPEHSAWQDSPEISPVPLPPLPDGRAMRAAIAAVLADDPAAQPAGAARNPPARPASGPSRAFTPFPPPADLRRPIGQASVGQLQSHSSGGARTGCVIALIIVGVVAFNIIAGIVQSVSALFS